MKTISPSPQKISSSPKSVYLPGLNGLRAIAAIAVVVSHIRMGLKMGLFGEALSKGVSDATVLLAEHGVTIFFTLSGFLITYLLLSEKQAAGKINIRDFYIRRMLRIWPLYYAVLIIAVLVVWYFKVAHSGNSIYYYLFLVANVPYILQLSGLASNFAYPFISHYWSLGVEEQFYLLFPPLARLNNKKFLRVTVALVVFFLVLKFVFWLILRRYGYAVPAFALHITRFHTMLIGVVAAILYFQQHPRFLKIATHPAAQGAAWLLLLLIAINKFHIASLIDTEIVAFMTVFLIMGQVTRANRYINLDKPLFNFIGKISYGIYVVHPLVIFFLGKWLIRFTSDNLFSYLLVYGMVTGATIGVSWLSYEYFEKWFLRMKERFSVIRSSSTGER